MPPCPSKSLPLGVGASARFFGAEHAGKWYAVKVIWKSAAAVSGFMRGEHPRELEVPGSGDARVPLDPQDVVGGRATGPDLLRHGAPITLRDRYLYCKELISVISALRDLDIVHGDIKPINVLIDPRGRAVLSDFGNAKDSSSCVDGYDFWKSRILSGTPLYMAPEVVSVDLRENGYGASAESVWSLGLIFLEIFGRFDGAYFNVWTVEDVLVKNAILLDSMLQYYEELRSIVGELIEWSAYFTN